MVLADQCIRLIECRNSSWTADYNVVNKKANHLPLGAGLHSVNQGEALCVIQPGRALAFDLDDRLDDRPHTIPPDGGMQVGDDLLRAEMGFEDEQIGVTPVQECL